MARFYPNFVGQQGIYYTGSPDYVDVKDTYLPLIGMRTFYRAATDENWTTNGYDKLHVNIQKDTENYKVWKGTWDLPNKRIAKITEEISIGTIVNGDNVSITATLSSLFLQESLAFVNPIVLPQETTSYNIPFRANGQTIRCLNADYVNYINLALHLPENAPINFHCRIVRENFPVIIYPPLGESINGTTTITVGAQYDHIFIYKRQAGSWYGIRN